MNNFFPIPDASSLIPHSFFLISLFLFLFSFPVFAQDATQILTQVKNNYEAHPNICARFTQTFHWKLAEETQIVNGNICIKDGVKFKIETDNQIAITDGKTLWTLNKINKQVIIDRAGGGSQENPLLKSFLQKYIENYVAKLVAAEKGDQGEIIYHLNLLAKSEDEFYQRIEIWIEKKSKSYFMKKIIQYDINGNETIYTINDLNLQADIPDSMFKPAIPDGYEVIDLR